MANTEQLRQRLETMLESFLGTDDLVTDSEGDYPVRAGSAKYYIRLSDETEPAVVHVYAHILVGVPASEKLYETLNSVNSFIKFGRMFHQGDAVLVSTELLADTLDLEELTESCRSIAELADRYDDLFKSEFGGRTYEDDAENVTA
jgi:hypothetical protein